MKMFVLPKEAAGIDKLMEKFGEHYFTSNPDAVLSNAGAFKSVCVGRLC